MKRKLIGLLCAVLCLLAMAQPALAAEAPKVKVPVEIVLEGNKPAAPEKYMVKMYADKAANPMPEGSENGAYTVVIHGAGTVHIPDITYNKIGVYTYTIYQLEGASRLCTYDDTIYSLTVTVSYAEDGSGLECTVALYADGGSTKTASATFTNRYAYEPGENPSDPSGGSNGNTPQTNDESNFPLYAMLAAGSILVLLLLFLTRKREEKY